MPENHGLAWRVWPNPDMLGYSEGLMARVGVTVAEQMSHVGRN